VIAALLPMAFVTGLMGPYMSPIPINCLDGHVHLAGHRLRHHALAGAEADEAGGARHRRRMAMATSWHRWPARPPVPPPDDALLDPQHGGRAAQAVARHPAGDPGSVSLASFKLVVLKMLPFDNKSEFQVVLDMPVGTPLEETAKVLREIGAEIAQVPEVADYQAYAGTASPINFNGLVRQYYLRSAPEMGDIQVNLVDKKHRDRQSHEIAVSVRDRVVAVALKHGGNAKVVEVPPGPPVMSPIVAEVYGPDYPGQIAVAKQVRAAFEGTPTSSASTTRWTRTPKSWCCA
jgi:multidrug efflux pump subunit AcrB